MKVVLVMDAPTTCTDCPCYDYIHGVCAKTHKDCELRKQEKPTWCPLRPLPSKKVPVFDPNSASYDEEYEKRIIDEINGWNACIEEIEK